MCRGLLRLTDSEEYARIQAGDKSSECKQLQGSTGSEHWKAATADNKAGKEQWKQTAADHRGFQSKAHAHAAATKAERYVCVSVCTRARVCVRVCAHAPCLLRLVFVLYTSPVVEKMHQT